MLPLFLYLFQHGTRLRPANATAFFGIFSSMARDWDPPIFLVPFPIIHYTDLYFATAVACCKIPYFWAVFTCTLLLIPAALVEAPTSPPSPSLYPQEGTPPPQKKTCGTFPPTRDPPSPNPNLWLDAPHTKEKKTRRDLGVGSQVASSIFSSLIGWGCTMPWTLLGS